MLSSSSKLSSDMDSVTIWQAARATSAAPGFFAPAVIGPDRIQFVDGGVGANNPVQYAMMAAERIWPERAVRCLVSLGSGHALMTSTPRRVGNSIHYLKEYNIDMENTAERFAYQHRHMIIEDEYYRFNVHYDMGEVFNMEWQDVDRIVTFTDKYCYEGENQLRFERCAERLTRHPRLQQEGNVYKNTIELVSSYR